MIVFACALAQLMPHPLFGQDDGQTLLSEIRHIRNAGPPEWSTFALDAVPALLITFMVPAPAIQHVLGLTQVDVKQDWRLSFNGMPIGRLIQDEKSTRTYFAIPAGVLNAGENQLSISSNASVADDILLGDIQLYQQSMEELMSAKVDVEIVDEKGNAIPGRITIINNKRSLQTFLCEPDKNIAVRAGCLYTPHRATLRLPAGTYMLYGGRGFEYGIDSLALTLSPGDHKSHRFVVRKEVDTNGWIASDTHVHTYTHSGHGDATLRERIITLAGEGIEMPVMTDHNTYVNATPTLDSVARTHPNVKMSLVMGDEVTTRVGHFNVFDIPTGADVIGHTSSDWKEVEASIDVVGRERVVILNHARDVHNSFRPFDPARHLSSVGMDRDGWKLPANAMEVINSGSQQTDFMLLFRDWFGMLNAGHELTPIGSSDSHDVNRYIVGQGRTYIKSEDGDESHIDIARAMRNLLKGEVMVSGGLLTKIVVNNDYGPGDLAIGKRKIEVVVDVLGPAWSNADSVILYMNGSKIREAAVVKRSGEPIRQRFRWKMKAPAHDVYFAAIAHGLAPEMPFWPIAKPYQPTSPRWTPRVYGASGTVWFDGDRNGRRESAAVYAASLLLTHGKDLKKLFRELSSFDTAVSAQVAAMMWRNGADLRSDEMRSLLQHSAVHVRRGFDIVVAEASHIRR